MLLGFLTDRLFVGAPFHRILFDRSKHYYSKKCGAKKANRFKSRPLRIRFTGVGECFKLCQAQTTPCHFSPALFDAGCIYNDLTKVLSRDSIAKRSGNLTVKEITAFSKTQQTRVEKHRACQEYCTSRFVS
jgi:hypothetical protein